MKSATTLAHGGVTKNPGRENETKKKGAAEVKRHYGRGHGELMIGHFGKVKT